MAVTHERYGDLRVRITSRCGAARSKRRRSTRWATTRSGSADVCLACPGIARAREIAHRFTALVHERTGHLLPDWISEVERDAPQPIRGFARFVKFDIDAVTAGLSQA
ncbi:hypothetical protein J7F03_37200 [Streptomyces sp. ISL-43]|uniref:hypothetical protein n=1 Tax=Streptomyces sp. ISL-43 TaxID=2819183 RepID=UPI001BE58E8A|nr:hypothetical protein [Streptomyces sp. ISL-43]MBT2452589.1 hypothetical protein [Streptomyces sp. ISL-43]